MRAADHNRIPIACRMALATVVISVGMGCGSGKSTGSFSPSSPAPTQKSAVTPILLFTGTGTSAPDVSALESVLQTLKLTYTTIDSAHLDAITVSQLRAYKLLIVPGGNSITIGQNLTATATAAVRNAVQQDGLHYLGVCAGAFFAGSSIYNGLDLTSGVWFDFYADEAKGVHKDAVKITLPDNSSLEAYWEDGPQLSGWGDVVAEFSDGTPAITQGSSGNGLVVLSGVHLEAPAAWRTGMAFTTPVSVDLNFAGQLVQAALTGNALPHF
jgi:Biotin-protein ligase, N terminal